MKESFEGTFENFGGPLGGWVLTKNHHNVLEDIGAKFNGKHVRITITPVQSVILCIFGSRTVKNAEQAWLAIEAGMKTLGIDIADIAKVIDGAASGADEIGHQWAICRALKWKRYPAEWADIDHVDALVRQGPYGPYNALAGQWRNEIMADVATHFIGLRSPGKSSGTDNMARTVRELNKPLSMHTIR